MGQRQTVTVLQSCVIDIYDESQRLINHNRGNPQSEDFRWQRKSKINGFTLDWVFRANQVIPFVSQCAQGGKSCCFGHFCPVRSLVLAWWDCGGVSMIGCVQEEVRWRHVRRLTARTDAEECCFGLVRAPALCSNVWLYSRSASSTAEGLLPACTAGQTTV